MALTKVTGQVINTSTDVTVGVLTVTNTLAVGGTVSIGGTLTYEDVTNIDSVGLITARNGIIVGSGITLSKDGDVFFTGIATGNGSGLTALNASNIGSGTVPTARLGSGTASSSTFLRGDSTFAAVTSTTINNNADNRVITGSGTANTLEGEANLTFNGTNFTTKASDSTTSANAGGSGVLIQNTNNTNNNQNFLGFYDSTGASSAAIIAQHENHSSTTGNLQFGTRNAGTYAERLRIHSDGTLSLGTSSSASAKFNISHGNEFAIYTLGGYNYQAKFESSDAEAAIIIEDSNSGTDYNRIGVITNDMAFTTNNNERLRIDSSGRVLIGTTATPSLSGTLNIFGTTNDTSSLSIRRGSADAAGPQIFLVKSRNTTDGSHTVVQNDDLLGAIFFAGNDSQGPEYGAYVKAEVDGGAGSNDMPTRLVFAVTPNGSDTPSEIIKIRQDGKIDLGADGPSSGIDPTSAGTLKLEADSGSNFGGSSIQFRVDNIETARMVAGTHRFFGLGRTSSQSNARCDINNESDQDVLFLTQNENDTSNRTLILLHTGAQSGFAQQVTFMDHQGVARGTIKNNTSSTQYNTSSDYRLKENEVAISDGIERIKQLKPYRFNWKNRPDTIVDGFFAHEVQDIVEDCVDGTKDELYTETNEELKIQAGDPKYQQMDHSKLVPLLTAALKEEISKRESLETRIAALEG